VCRTCRQPSNPVVLIRPHTSSNFGAAMRVVTLGEVMLRLAPEEFLRLPQILPGRLEATFGGGEVNVAVAIAQQGGEAAFATVLPDNVLTDAFAQELRKLNVDARLLRRSKRGRFGIYFVETGAN